MDVPLDKITAFYDDIQLYFAENPDKIELD